MKELLVRESDNIPFHRIKVNVAAFSGTCRSSEYDFAECDTMV